MADVSDTYLTTILISEARTWMEAESGAYDAGGARLSALSPTSPAAGIPVASSPSAIALLASGEQEWGTEVDVYVRRGGTPGPDALAVLAKRSTEDYQGCDPPIRQHGGISISATTNATDPHIVALDSGAVVTAWWDSGLGIMTRTLGADGVLAAAVTVTAYVASDAIPCLCPVPHLDGQRLWLYWCRTTATRLEIRGYFSDDEGATWTTAAAVANAIAVASYSACYRIRAVENHGQIMMILWLAGVGMATYIDVLMLLASPDGGHMFEQVATQTGAASIGQGGAYPDIAKYNIGGVSGWLVAWMQDAGANVGAPRVQVVTSAYNPPWDALPTSGVTFPVGATWATLAGVGPVYYDDGDLACWVDDDGVCYVAGRDTVSCAAFVVRSIDPLAQNDWNGTGVSARWTDAQNWHDGGAVTGYLTRFSACAHRGRTTIATRKYRLAAVQGMVDLIHLGGWTTHTLPHSSGGIDPTKRTAWERTLPPNLLASDLAAWLTTGGVGSETMAGGIATVTGAYSWFFVPTATLTEGIIGEYEYDTTGVGAGTVITNTVRVADATGRWQAEVRWTATTILLWDSVAAAQIGATYTRVSTRARVVLAVVSGTARALITEDVLDDYVFDTEITGALAAGAASTNLCQTDVAAGATVTRYGERFTYGPYSGDQLTTAVTTLALYPRALRCDAPVYLLAGVSAWANSGPGMIGDTFTITPTADYSPSRLDPLGDYPSPSEGFRQALSALPAGTRSIRLTWSLDRGAGWGPSDLWGSYISGINSPQVSVYAYYGGAYNLLGTMPIERFSATRSGVTWRCDTSGTSGSYIWGRGELDGCGVAVRDGAGSVALETTIERQREGSTVPGAATVPLYCEVASSVGLGAGPYDLAIWLQEGLLVTRLSALVALGATIERIQLRFPAPAAGVYPGRPASGDIRCSVFAAGHMMALRRPDRGHVREYDPQIEIITADDGTMSARRAGNGGTTYDLVWSGPVVWDSSSVPNYQSSGTAGLPIAWAKDWMIIEEQIRQMEGGLYPVVVAPSTPRPVTSTWLVSRHVCGALYGRCLDPVTSESKLGEEYRSDVAAVQRLLFRAEE